MIKHLAALATGILFGVGLAVSSMINPEKVLAFLDVAGDWDPSLALVMGGAVAVTMVTFRRVLRAPAPLFGARFELPGTEILDAPLIMGAVIFGIGWGLGGYCPGPAIASLSFGTVEPPIFILAFIAGNFLSVALDRLRSVQP